MQAPFMSLLAVAKGTSVMTETIFENRFSHVGELQRMGANIKIDSRSAVIEGVETLTGAKVRATDLRAGAALILSALAAKGETEISDIYHIERGYDRIDESCGGWGRISAGRRNKYRYNRKELPLFTNRLQFVMRRNAFLYPIF